MSDWPAIEFQSAGLISDEQQWLPAKSNRIIETFYPSLRSSRLSAKINGKLIPHLLSQYHHPQVQVSVLIQITINLLHHDHNHRRSVHTDRLPLHQQLQRIKNMPNTQWRISHRRSNQINNYPKPPPSATQFGLDQCMFSSSLSSPPPHSNYYQASPCIPTYSIATPQ